MVEELENETAVMTVQQMVALKESMWVLSE